MVLDLTVQLPKYCIYVSNSNGTHLLKSTLIAIVMLCQWDLLQAEC